MKFTYEEIVNDLGSTLIKKTDEEGKIWWVPLDESNADYQAYLNKDNPDWGKPTFPVVEEAPPVEEETI